MTIARPVSKRNESPLTPILEVELFDVSGIYFMVSFLSSFFNKYVFVDYVTNCVEFVALPHNQRKSVAQYLKCYIFSIFRTPRAIISDD